ncbi:MAG: hypothetical protein JSR45_02705 [Proteobacteria bacterium]|nr:hypothetical protein [Pseudomonadota bacterium]
MKRLTPLVLLLALTACETTTRPFPGPRPEPAPPPNPVDYQFGWSARSGANSITGSVAYRTKAGGAFTCAGRSVALTPAAPMSAERTERLYGSTEHAVSSIEAVRERSAGQAAPAYANYVRAGQCDETGHFAFQDLPDGAWFLIVTAKPARAGEPVVIMRAVEARGGIRQTVAVR